jgi:hypothetical protein
MRGRRGVVPPGAVYTQWKSPCFCGKGRFFVGWESENYPPFRQSFDASIGCPECEREYYPKSGSCGLR